MPPLVVENVTTSMLAAEEVMMSLLAVKEVTVQTLAAKEVTVLPLAVDEVFMSPTATITGTALPVSEEALAENLPAVVADTFAVEEFKVPGLAPLLLADSSARAEVDQACHEVFVASLEEERLLVTAVMLQPRAVFISHTDLSAQRGTLLTMTTLLLAEVLARIAAALLVHFPDFEAKHAVDLLDAVTMAAILAA